MQGVEESPTLRAAVQLGDRIEEPWTKVDSLSIALENAAHSVRAQLRGALQQTTAAAVRGMPVAAAAAAAAARGVDDTIKVHLKMLLWRHGVEAAQVEAQESSAAVARPLDAARALWSFETVVSRERARVAGMQDAIAHIDAGGAAPDQELSQTFARYRSHLEHQWQAGESDLSQQVLEQVQEEAAQAQARERRRRVLHTARLDVFLRRRKACWWLHSWRAWALSRRSLVAEGRRRLDRLIAPQRQASPRQRGAAAAAQEPDIAMLAERCGQLEKQLSDAKLAATENNQSRRYASRLQSELHAVLDVAIRTHETSRRTHKRVVAMHRNYQRMLSDGDRLSEYRPSSDSARTTLHVDGIEGELQSEDALRNVFEQYGTVNTVHVQNQSGPNGGSLSWAVVTMKDEVSAKRVLAERQIVCTTPLGSTTILTATAPVEAEGVAKRIMFEETHSTGEEPPGVDSRVDVRAIKLMRHAEHMVANSEELLRVKLRGLAHSKGSFNIMRMLRNFDKNRTRKLEYDEWQELVRVGAGLGKAVLPDRESLQVFRKIDLNCDGAISLEELTIYLQTSQSESDELNYHLRKMLATFRRKLQAASYVLGGSDPATVLRAFEEKPITAEDFRDIVRRYSWPDILAGAAELSQYGDYRGDADTAEQLIAEMFNALCKGLYPGADPLQQTLTLHDIIMFVETGLPESPKLIIDTVRRLGNTNFCIVNGTLITMGRVKSTWSNWTICVQRQRRIRHASNMALRIAVGHCVRKSFVRWERFSRSRQLHELRLNVAQESVNSLHGQYVTFANAAEEVTHELDELRAAMKRLQVSRDASIAESNALRKRVEQLAIDRTNEQQIYARNLAAVEEQFALAEQEINRKLTEVENTLQNERQQRAVETETFNDISTRLRDEIDATREMLKTCRQHKDRQEMDRAVRLMRSMAQTAAFGRWYEYVEE
eukprot:SAG25_NODE_1456_length_2982_cov_220.754769_1_plen_942_part_10